MSNAAQRLRHVLAGQKYPAERWQLIAGAEFYGADIQSLRELHALPPRRYASFADVLTTIDGSPIRTSAA